MKKMLFGIVLLWLCAFFVQDGQQEEFNHLFAQCAVCVDPIYREALAKRIRACQIGMMTLDAVWIWIRSLSEDGAICPHD